MSGLGGPRASEVRLGLGVDRSITAAVVPTASQAGCCTQQDRQNNGYSGTPLWKLAQERAQKERESGLLHPAVKLPEGFKPVDKVTSVHLPPKGRWYYSEKKQIFWNAEDGKMYVWDAATLRHLELYEAQTYPLRITAGSCFHERAAQVRHVLVKDLAKAGQALRMSIGHLDSPCALYALYEGHRGASSPAGVQNLCSEFCVKHLHQKLLPKLAAFQGYWEDTRLAGVVREAFQELDAEFAEKHASAVDGCCAAIALLIGQRLVLACLGDVACVVVTRDGEALELRGGVLRDPDEDEEDEEESGAVGPAATSTGSSSIRWTRSFGDLDFKRPGSQPRLSATPDVQVLQLEHCHQGIALVCRALYDAIGRSAAVSTVFRRSRGRPRMASGALVDAAVQWLGQVSDQGLGCIVVFFDGVEAADSPPAKKAKTEQPSQVRLRHILLKHRECKSTVDKVRNRQVKRTRGEAERQLRAVLEECECDPKRRAFTPRCKELSECTTSLSAGDLAGDLGWVKPGKLGQAIDAAAFPLQVGQMSDLVDTEQGIHIIMRVA
uniref:Peptidylprolyl isomerase n=1 Tax=Alexandrium monilatum TaxID=311494 RepID=A0A6T1I8L9_9DINO|mmetsp:Transcript_98743/g.313333  ORF Transcript_98743/g.313333 Transcript_98743/m.313333 type:complete len:551 (-) Transcript_98743:135-1787(-)